ncbi:MAG: SsrA-binding protein SmpB [Weeksellaceae bacterium]|nr:SsrA-binding protein SmpB [Weeksellaceae bacterium]
MQQKQVQIKNRKARFEYELMEKFDCGIQLTGTEIKSIRMGKASITESFCEVKNDEVFVVNMHIDEYDWGTHFNHKVRRTRKLLLTKKEIKKISRKVKETGLTLIPTLLYINDRGFAKMIVYLARGKKLYDKRNSLKEKDLNRKMQQIQNNL